MLEHDINCLADLFQRIITGETSHVVASREGLYLEGDALIFHEVDPDTGELTGRAAADYEVTTVETGPETPDGHVQLTFRPIG